MSERNRGILSILIVLTVLIFGFAMMPGISEAGKCIDNDADAYAIGGKNCGPVDCNDADPLVNPGMVEDCGNGIDDDCDGDVDVNDLDCCVPTSNAERYHTGECSDGIDNNCNGLVDCEDRYDCIHPAMRDTEICPCLDEDGDTYSPEGEPPCGPTDCNDADPLVNPGAVEDCTDGIDNDCDNLIDYQDPDAVNCPPCPDADGDTFSPEGGICGPVDCNDANATVNPGAGEVCDNTIDDDCDGYTDGNDPDCGGCIPTNPRTEVCDDGLDNDCDGRTDCEFFGCFLNPACGEVDCDDGLDNDGNGLFDCDDPYCQEYRQSVCGEYFCTDGGDNDGDGDVDCADADCADDPACGPEVCNDGIDNDGDGKVDCDDKKDCGKDPAC